MVTALTTEQPTPETLMQVLANGNIADLSSGQKLSFLQALCQSLNLNPLTRPFQFIELWDSRKKVLRETLYATKDCTEQLRKLHRISCRITSRDEVSGAWVVTAQASDAGGRTDEAIGAVWIKDKAGDDLANALMKAETKAKRRVTLSICGLGLLDESELETIPGPPTVRVVENKADLLYEPQPLMKQPDVIAKMQQTPVPPSQEEQQRRSFWGTANRLAPANDWIGPDGRLSKKLIHRALGFPEVEGALAEHVASGAGTYATLEHDLRLIAGDLTDDPGPVAP